MNDPLGNILNIRWPRMIKIEVVDGCNRDRIGCKNSRAIIENKRKKKSDRKRRSSFILVSCNNERIVINNKRKYCETQKLLYLTCTYLGIYTYIYRVHNLSSFVSLDEKSQSCSE